MNRLPNSFKFDILSIYCEAYFPHRCPFETPFHPFLLLKQQHIKRTPVVPFLGGRTGGDIQSDAAAIPAPGIAPAILPSLHTLQDLAWTFLSDDIFRPVGRWCR
jgi:hypothetical protein